jgi:hypothetical protein
MPKKKKPAQEMTTGEIARAVFPGKVVKELQRLANPSKTSRASRKKSNK